MTIVFAVSYIVVGLCLSIYIVRKSNKHASNHSDQYVGFAALVTGALWPIEVGIRLCGLFGKLGKSKGE